MQKFRIWGALWLLAFLLIGFYLLSETRASYQELTDRAIYNIVSGIREDYPAINTGDLVEMASRPGQSDLRDYGIYEGRGLLSFADLDHKILVSYALFFTFSLSTLIFLLFTFHRDRQKTIEQVIRDMEKINQGIYDISLINEEDDLARLQNELYKLTIKLREESENAKNSKEALKKSLEDISHQIKTPISAIKLLLENINDPEIKEEEKNGLLAAIQLEADAITNLVLMLLNVALLESGTLHFKREKIQLAPLLREVTDLLQALSRSRGIRIISQVDDIAYWGDPKWEKELYLNLLKNGLDHAKGDFVKVSARDTKTYLAVVIENLADPISEDESKKIFQRFYKRSLKEGSYGIGLNLCQMIAESNNAKINIESRGQIVRFTVKYYKQTTI